MIKNINCLEGIFDQLLDPFWILKITKVKPIRQEPSYESNNSFIREEMENKTDDSMLKENKSEILSEEDTRAEC